MCARKRAGSRIPRISRFRFLLPLNSKIVRDTAAEDTIDSGGFQPCKKVRKLTGGDGRRCTILCRYNCSNNIFVEVTFEDSKENIQTYNTARETNIAVFTRLMKGLLLIIML